ncbi:MAG: ATP-binding cassette domain-containing protein [Desulfohalobiaceae bacterium]
MAPGQSHSRPETRTSLIPGRPQAKRISRIDRERRKQLVDLLSGGELQMVNLGRALMTRPKLIMLDELGQGLAPVLTREAFDTGFRSLKPAA